MSTDNWPSKLAAPLPPDSISWRQDGKPTQRDGKYVARFVAYTDAQVVRQRLDDVVPGEWDLSLELLPAQTLSDEHGEALCAFKARLKILDVVREDVGQGKDYKSASTDAFKRAAVRFGIGHELYSMGLVWVTVDGDSKYAKALEDPATVYARKNGATSETRPRDDSLRSGSRTADTATAAPAPDGPIMDEEVLCPKCSGRMWDNRLSKRNPKQPDFKCRNRACDGVIWPPKPNGARTNRTGRDDTEGPYEAPLDEPPPYEVDGPIPF